MTETIRPDTEEGVLEAVEGSLGSGSTLELVGTGTKRAYGRPVSAAQRLDLSALSGIRLYEPNELVLQAGAGTPMAEIARALDAAGQQLAFEPQDMAFLLGGEEGGGTLGGVVAAGLAGPRRVKDGSVRDHVLGFRAVSGAGEVFKSGGRVVKNVTGFDLSKLMAGSFGTLAAMTEVTVKTLPRPEKTRTVLVAGLDADVAVRAMAAALGSPFEVSAAAHLPHAAAARSAVSYVAGAGAAVTAVRVEGFGPSVTSRTMSLQAMLSAFGQVEELHSANSVALWREIRDARLLSLDGARQVWRLSVVPGEGAAVARRLAGAVVGAEWILDWGGGLVWAAVPQAADAHEGAVRAALGPGSGHATLVRAEEDVRRRVAVFQPSAAAVDVLTRRIKETFDPKGILNPGRMGPED